MFFTTGFFIYRLYKSPKKNVVCCHSQMFSPRGLYCREHSLTSSSEHNVRKSRLDELKGPHLQFSVTLESTTLWSQQVLYPFPTWATLECREVTAVLGIYGWLAGKEPCFVLQAVLPKGRCWDSLAQRELLRIDIWGRERKQVVLDRGKSLWCRHKKALANPLRTSGASLLPTVDPYQAKLSRPLCPHFDQSNPWARPLSAP